MNLTDRIKKSLRPPLTQQWVDLVTSGYEEREAKIRERRGDQTADRYRERADRSREKLQQRVDPDLTRIHDEMENGKG